MHIIFYELNDPSIKINKVNKTKVGETEATPQPTAAVNVVDPVLVIDKDKVPATANYAYIEEYGRSYFISGIDWTIANTAIVALHSDVLSNFADQLGVLNFVGGADEVGEIEDGSYPLGDYLKVDRFKFNNWDNTFFTNANTGQRYLLRIADGHSSTENITMDLQIGDQILYKNLLFTLEGSYNGAYLSDPTEIPLPPSQPYPRVADGTVFSIYTENGDLTYSQDYQFKVYFESSSLITLYSIVAIHD